MRFIDKIKKLNDPRLGASMKRHTGRFLLTRRFVFRITPERIIASIDPQEFHEVHQRHAVPDPGEAPEKYLELHRWLTVNIRRIRELDLDWGARRRVLDIGCGAGYFLYICKWLGHDVLGLDIDESPMFNDLTKLLGVPRVTWRIAAFQPLPDLGEKFDVISAYMICFNNHNRPNVWGPAEWSFWLDDIARHLKPNGRLWLEMNPERTYGHFTPELRQLFLSRGAVIDHHRVIFNASLRAPA